MSFYSKIKTIAETMTNYNVIVDTTNGANVEFDKLEMPAILILVQQSGSINTNHSHYRDTANVRIILFNKIPQDFKDNDTDSIKDTLKNDLISLYHKIRFNFDFKVNTSELKYNIVYDEYDANLIGFVIDDIISERIGVNLACDVTPQPQSFEVNILDQDGNVVRTFTTSGQYVVTILSGIQDTITANTSTIIEPLT